MKNLSSVPQVSSQPEAMHEFTQRWPRKAVSSDQQIRAITWMLGGNELERGNMEALRWFKSSPQYSRIERLYPERAGGRRDEKKQKYWRDTQCLPSRRLSGWAGYGVNKEGKNSDNSQVSDLGSQVDSGSLIKKK